MGISKKKLEDFKKSIDNAKKILVFFDDDCDGLAAFLQVHQYKECIGVAIRAVPELRADYMRKVKEHEPDLILVFDMAMINEEFLEANKVPLIWVDHHEPKQPKGITYLNPHLEDEEDNRPTSYWVHQALNSNVWLATLGCIADWFWPEFADEFKKEYPDLLPKEIKTAPDALFNSKLGTLVQVFLFNLKGTVSDMNKSIRTFTKIKSPLEILNQASEAGQFLYKRYAPFREEYERILNSIPVSTDKFAVHIYENAGNAYSSEISNELMYRYPEKVFLIGRKNQGKIHASLRAVKIDVWTPLQKALTGLEASGGGHKNACGLSVKENELSRLIDALRKELS
ncbi:MAG TPA: DHHA1 domain-containing protein [Candidatus Nanoarchaeia archaeon]|nr:DHHA1 domain-containing protein [Candidatus Nanoarchaeia archaeon]